MSGTNTPHLPTDALLSLCGGNAAAVALIEEAHNLAEVYDDFIDNDGRASAADVHRAFAFALFGLHANPVYRNNPGLQTVLLQTVALWRAATDLERDPARRDVLEMTYVMRCAPYGFYVAVVMAVSGMEAAIEAAKLLFAGQDADTFASYVAGLTAGG